MRKLILAVVVYWLLFGVSAVAETYGQKYFPSGEACVQALQTGSAQFYVPSFRNLYKPVSTGEAKVALEGNACVIMMTVKGFAWVAQREGDVMVIKNGVIVRRYDCGNPITAVLYPKAAVAIIQECPPGTTRMEGSTVCIQTIEKDRIVTKTVEVPKNVYVNPCPSDAVWDGTISAKSRWLGGMMQAGISTGVSVGMTKIRGSSWERALKSGLYGFGMQRTQQALNPSEDGVRLLIPSLGIAKEIRRDHNLDLAPGLVVRWDGATAYLIRTVEGNAMNCSAFGLRSGSNMGVWTDGVSSSNKRIPIKTQTPSQLPRRPSVIRRSCGTGLD